MNAKKIQSSKFFQVIKNAFASEVKDEVKNQVVNNIVKSNSKEYKWQKASNEVLVNVIDDMLNDPQWKADIVNYLAKNA